MWIGAATVTLLRDACMSLIIRKDIDCLNMTLISIICLFYITLHEEKTYKKKHLHRKK